ncbi:inactive phospholipase C-like protein 1 isoform X2 [Daphnia pulex]|uniref:inactive phospholipase C-like protein 1 isoform X2 n=1 Tax=Daphnia pulex TaxID=6669 RepID=UPI001EDF0BAE|nr:inactive phospholipase C-like protein 1 isoform X2 [Daphnia pulex]
MESTLSVDKSRPAVQQQQQPKQPKQVELAESEDVSHNSLVNESGSYERHGSSSSGQQLGAQQLPLEPGLLVSYQVKATKSVLFDTRSTTHAHNKKVQSVADCWRWMVRGSNLVKVRPNGRTYNRFFSLDEDLSCIRWVPTSKKASKATVPISSIREVRSVHTSEVLGQGTSSVPTSGAGAAAAAAAASATSSASSVSGVGVGCGASSLDWTFSVIHGDDFSSLDLIASSAEEATIWVTGLNALLGTHLSPNALGETDVLRERWLREAFERAVSDTSASINEIDNTDETSSNALLNLDQDAAMALLKEINADLAASRIRQKMAEFDSMKSPADRGRINSDEFVTMFQEMATRPEIYFLLIRFANRDYFTADDFLHFLECEQAMTGVTLEKCCQLIQLYEPSSEARADNQLLLDGMTRFLLSEEGDIFHPLQMHVHQDMTFPMCHYFISSSHNTYLLEDQLRGPSSVEGYARALQSGCRCIKIDVWDGPETPIVYHGNTLTTKIAFSDVVSVIAQFAFEASKYPLFVHLENHCSISQQKTAARIITELFGSALLRACDKPLTSTSPEDLVGKIIIFGKKFGSDQMEDGGEVTDEDEGAETNRTRAGRVGQASRRLRICRELSDLIALNRGSSIKLPSSRDKKILQQCGYSLSESAASRLHASSPGMWTEMVQRSLLRVFPNGSRVDSSNFSPLEFWNAGVPMVALNFQTPGLMMDLYDGKFRQNGGCGYVLKPAMMRQPGFSVPSSLRESAPISPPQLLRIRIISGQQLPRPRGSAAKATIVDPYVLIQIYGIPIDCAERKTRTIPDEGDCPIFEESLEFYIHHPEMALIRFIVLDDEFIGDDFIGQYTIPFPCIRPGYRHVRLLSNLGEALENTTLFVHVAVSEKWAGELLPKNRSKHGKKQAVIRMTGLRQLDEHFKSSIGAMVESSRARNNVAQALFELRSECGLPITSNVKQCLRVLLQRLANCPEVVSCQLSSENVFPVLKIETNSGGGVSSGGNGLGNLPTPLYRTLVAFEKSILECHFLRDKSPAILRELEEVLQALSQFPDHLDTLIEQAGLKGKQSARVYDVHGWNLSLITTHVELLRQCQRDCGFILDQIRSANISLDGLIRHNSERCSQHLQVVLSSSSGFGTGDESGGGPLSSTSSPARSNGNAAHLQLSRCTTSPMQANSEDVQKLSEPKLKGILKKSSSAQDITAPTDGYVITSNHAGSAAAATAGHSPHNLYNSSPSPSGSSCTVAPLASMASSISSNSSDDGAATSAS